MEVTNPTDLALFYFFVLESQENGKTEKQKKDKGSGGSGEGLLAMLHMPAICPQLCLVEP